MLEYGSGIYKQAIPGLPPDGSLLSKAFHNSIYESDLQNIKWFRGRRGSVKVIFIVGNQNERQRIIFRGLLLVI